MRNIEDYELNYVKEGFEDYQVAYRRKKVLEQIEKYNPKHILEIGCGMVPLFSYTNNITYTIVEPSKKFCENAIELSKKIGVEVCIINDFFGEKVACDLDKRFDMIICSSLLHEVEEPERMLEALFKACDDKTIIHVNVPNAKSFHRVLAKNTGIILSEHEKSERNKKLQQNMVFDLESLKTMVLNHHFEILDMGSYFIKPFTHEQMYQMIEKKIIDKSILDGLYNMINDLPMMGSEIFVDCRKASC